MTFDSEYEPFFQPPGWIIGPIWAVLYTTIAVSFMMTFNKKEDISYSNIVFISFFIQIILNFLWPSVFNSEKYLLSLIMLILMIFFTIVYAYLIYQTVPTASKLVWPYIAWMALAAVINAAYYLNSIEFF
tara:strand:+ start:4575 stop:4964 length:390 start_codon:yes stop_codon:yes gene_type:complete